MSTLPPAFGVRLVNSCRTCRLLAVPELVGAGRSFRTLLANAVIGIVVPAG
ncbi:hypothetical protein D3C83_184130 [compost metagenome]